MQTRELELYNELQVMRGLLCIPEMPVTPKTGVILIHGWKSHRGRHEQRAQALCELGLYTVAFNLRGHGITGERPSGGNLNELSRYDHLTDLIRFYRYLERECQVERMGIMGGSYGGYLGASFAKNIPVDYLALWDPSLYPDEGFYEPTAEQITKTRDAVFKQSGLTPAVNRALSGVTKVQRGILLVHAEKADVIPPATIEDYSQAALGKPFTQVKIAGSDHALSSPNADQLMTQTLVDWFRDQTS